MFSTQLTAEKRGEDVEDEGAYAAVDRLYRQ